MAEKYVLTEYTLSAPIALTMAVVSDLHQTDPAPVLQLLQQLQPDVIFVPGDTFERIDRGEDPRKTSDYSRFSRLMHDIIRGIDDRFGGSSKGNLHSEYAYGFLRAASALAPTFVSRGNHEWYLLPEDRKVMDDCGVVFLDNQDTLWNGIRIGGLSSGVDEAWLQDFSQKDGYKVLLCHHPEYYDTYLQDKPLDLILSGHAHGGQMRLFGRGVLSPGQGFFPKYSHGLYHDRLVVSAGCSNTAAVPRWGNPCEVVAIHLQEKK